MQVEAIYDDGRITLVTPLKLRHRRVPVIVSIPDAEVEAEPLDEFAQQLVARLDAIRAAPLPPAPGGPVPDGERLDRIEAFALRVRR